LSGLQLQGAPAPAATSSRSYTQTGPHQSPEINALWGGSEGEAQAAMERLQQRNPGMTMRPPGSAGWSDAQVADWLASQSAGERNMGQSPAGGRRQRPSRNVTPIAPDPREAAFSLRLSEADPSAIQVELE